jgi:DNA helicase HerA-like ATPase
MGESKKMINALVTGVFPDKVKIEVKDIDNFKVAGEKLSVGSYLRISDSEDCAIIAIIENFCIEKDETDPERKYVLEAIPIGFLDNEGRFLRGGNNIAIPPSAVEPANKEEIQKIYAQIEENKIFSFSRLMQDDSIVVPVDGDRFFNKHISIIGATGSGKSCALTSILQKAVKEKAGPYTGLNNSHIIIFDLHGEYQSAFPGANHLNADNLLLPYWLMNGEELEELFVEAGEYQAYNQVSLLRSLITVNKQRLNKDDKILFDSPVFFSIRQVLNCIRNLSRETRSADDPLRIMIKNNTQNFKSEGEKMDFYFQDKYEFESTRKAAPKQGIEGINKGTFNDGSLEKFISRIKNKITYNRLKFLLGKDVEKITFRETLEQILSYKEKNEANITIIDLSGVPFDVLSITVSLITRLVFEFGYYFKRTINESADKAPILLVYEEAHKYVPKSQSSKYKSSREAIERVAKEGRKYAVTLVLLTQRPSEISETIFSQCNNFVAMRLTNPDDQNYVKRLLPDSLGPLTESLSILGSGDAILIGDSLVMPSLVKIDRCEPEPSSKDVSYLQEWKKEWIKVAFDEIIDNWSN